jgi:hypothetical protein
VTVVQIGEPVRRDSIVLALIMAATFAYVLARSWLSPITHDEALTSTYVISDNVRNILWFETPYTDNNHILFALLAKFTVFALGNNEFALRLPSIISALLYGGCAALILCRHLRGLPLWLFFAAAVWNPSVLDMLTIARGYGVGIGFTTAGIYCLLRGSEQAEQGRVLWWTATTTCMAIATLAHLSFLLFLAVAGAVMLVIEAHEFRNGQRRGLSICVAFAGSLLVCLMIAPTLLHQIAMLQRHRLLANGGLVSFYHDTVGDSVLYSLGKVPVPHWLFATIAASAYVVPAAGAGIALLGGRVAGLAPLRDHGRRDLAILLAILLGVALLSVLQHYLNGVAYLTDRRTAVMVSCFLLTGGVLAGAFLRAPTARLRVPGLTLTGFALLLVLFAARGYELRSRMLWQFDADTPAMLADVQSLLEHRNDPEPVRLGIDWIFEPAINYYLARNGFVRIAPVTRDGPIGQYDYYFLQEPPSFEDLPTLVDVERAVGPLSIVRRYPSSGTILAVPAGSAAASSVQAGALSR